MSFPGFCPSDNLYPRWMRRRIPALTELSVRRMDEASEPAAKTPGMVLRRLCAGNAGIRLSDARFVLQRHPLFSQVSENSEQLPAS